MAMQTDTPTASRTVSPSQRRRMVSSARTDCDHVKCNNRIQLSHIEETVHHTIDQTTSAHKRGSGVVRMLNAANICACALCFVRHSPRTSSTNVVRGVTICLGRDSEFTVSLTKSKRFPIHVQNNQLTIGRRFIYHA